MTVTIYKIYYLILVCGLRTGNKKSMLVYLMYFIFIKIIYSWITILMVISSSSVTRLMILVFTSTYFDKHIDRIVVKTYFAFRNVHVFRQAYITYIKPLLEYASNVGYITL